MPGDEKQLNLNNELAKERTRLANDRTLMAWVRTSLALIGFGFALAQGYEYLESEYLERTGRLIDAMHTPFYVGIAFMALGMLGCLAGATQYRRVLRRIKSDAFEYTGTWPLPLVFAVLMLAIGIFGLIALLI